MSKAEYHPEKYWSEVGERIEQREDEHNVIAGDDEPFYRYKRKRFLALLHGVNFKSKSVLEVGCGPGGNLKEILSLQPKRLVGCDISSQMVKLARKNLPPEVEIVKTNGTQLPFGDMEFDVIITATVLQHNTDEKMLLQLISEICRTSAKQVFIFERIESQIKGDALCLGRPVEYYSNLFEKHGFRLSSKKFINIRTSYYISGGIRKLLNPKTRREGEPLNSISIFLQRLTLPFSKIMDGIFPSNKDVARLEFVRELK